MQPEWVWRIDRFLFYVAHLLICSLSHWLFYHQRGQARRPGDHQGDSQGYAQGMLRRFSVCFFVCDWVSLTLSQVDQDLIAFCTSTVFHVALFNANTGKLVAKLSDSYFSLKCMAICPKFVFILRRPIHR
jgi:hypothetical protein